MALVNSLLTAIVRADGDALVLHVGERPYVVTSGGNVDLSNSVLTLDAVLGMLAQLLPQDLLNSLSDLGAVEYHLQPPSPMPDAFTVVAARGGDDIWIEVRRKRPVTFAPTEPPKTVGVVKAPEMGRVLEMPSQEAGEVPAVAATPPPTPAPEPELAEVGAVPTAPAARLSEAADVAEVAHVPEVAEAVEVADVAEVAQVAEVAAEATETIEMAKVPEQPAVEDVAAVAQVPEGVIAQPAASNAPRETEVSAAAASGVRYPDVAPVKEPVPDNVVPMTRVSRVEVPARSAPTESIVERLLGNLTTRGASMLYLTSQSRPFLRVEGAMRAIDSEQPLAAADIDAIVRDLLPDAAREAHGRGEPAEWISEFDGVGRTRCLTFRDHRGPGVLFQVISTRPVAADQLGLAREIQALANESEGLVVVAGPRGGGKSTMVAALVDLINRQQSGSVITIEREISIVHDNRLSLVSQREVGGTGAAAVVRAALRENPDVLVLEDMNAPEVVQLALEAAGSGLLVFLTMTAGSTVSALTGIVDAFPPEARKGAQAALAERLRGAVSQVVLRKASGGRIAARELLLTSAAVATLIADGQFARLAVAIESGRKHGMVSLNDVLLSLVKSGTVNSSEAYRKSDNRPALLTLLGRDGVDTTPLERLA